MTAEDLKAQGNKAFSAGDFTTAITFFSQAIELDPKNHVLYSNRSGSYASLKKYDEALQDAEKTVECKPDWAKGYSRKGAALYGLKKYKEAAEAYKAGLKIDPNNAQLTKGLEDTEAAMGADSASPFGKMFGPDIWAKIAGNPKLSPYLSQPDFCQKITEIQSDNGNLSKHIQDPRVMQVLSALLGVEMRTASPDEFKAAEEEEVPPPAPREVPKKEKKKEEPVPMEVEMTEEEKKAKDSRAESDKVKDEGNKLYKSRKFEEALEKYAAAYSLDDTNVAVLSNKAAVLYEMGRYKEAIEVCDQAVERGRELRVDYKLVGRALGRAGNAYAQLKDYPNAIKYLNKSLAEHRTKEVLEKLREIEKLQKLAEEEAYQNPEIANAEREKGNELFKKHLYADAVKCYTESIKRNPRDPRGYSNRAACYVKLMALPEADKDCDKAIELDENFVKAYIRKAGIYYAKKDYMKAIDICNLAKEKDTDGKNKQEIDAQIYQCHAAINQVQNSDNREEALKQAMSNPEVQAILADPAMNAILQQMQTDPAAVRDHMKNKDVAAKIRTLINAGVLRMA
ncbi:hypothetical protein HK098_004741 [Nowakowskiella sp. JEL0407]|nr:hypothetical protein HK098_004741 [Nowakowskiella sp. JEL0407]